MKPWIHAVGALAGIAVAISFEAWSTSSYGPRNKAHYAQVEDATMTPKEVASGFSHLALEEGEPEEATQRYASKTFLDHENTTPLPPGPLVVEQIAVDGDIAMIHFRSDAAGGASGVDILRVQDRKIAERWRVIQAAAGS